MSALCAEELARDMATMGAYTVTVDGEQLVVEVIAELDGERVLVSILAPTHWRGITMPVEADRLEPHRPTPTQIHRRRFTVWGAA